MTRSEYRFHVGLPETPEEPQGIQMATSDCPEQAWVLGGHAHQWRCTVSLILRIASGNTVGLTHSVKPR